jgi:hypothetical protein
LADSADLAALFASVRALEAVGLPASAEGGEGIDELFGLQPLDGRAAEDKRFVIRFRGRSN